MGLIKQMSNTSHKINSDGKMFAIPLDQRSHQVKNGADIIGPQTMNNN